MSLVFLIGIAFVIALPLLIAAIVLAVVLTKRRKPGSSQEEEAVQKSLGEVIRAHRARCGMTQEALAESLGVSRQAVSKWESGTSGPSAANLIALAKLFGLSVDELLKEVK